MCRRLSTQKIARTAQSRTHRPPVAEPKPIVFSAYHIYGRDVRQYHNEFAEPKPPGPVRPRCGAAARSPTGLSLSSFLSSCHLSSCLSRFCPRGDLEVAALGCVFGPQDSGQDPGRRQGGGYRRAAARGRGVVLVALQQHAAVGHHVQRAQRRTDRARCGDADAAAEMVAVGSGWRDARGQWRDLGRAASCRRSALRGCCRATHRRRRRQRRRRRCRGGRTRAVDVGHERQGAAWPRDQSKPAPGQGTDAAAY